MQINTGFDRNVICKRCKKVLRLYRPGSTSHRLDENSDTAAYVSVVAFYEKEFKAFLNTVIQQYKEIMKACFKKCKPSQYSCNYVAFAAEFEVFVNYVVNMTEGPRHEYDYRFYEKKAPFSFDKSDLQACINCPCDRGKQ